MKVLGLPAKCRKAKFEDENREREALIEFNRQREKVPSQIYNEAKTLRELYAKEGRSDPFDAEKPQVLNSAPGEKTRDKISAMVGVKRDKLSKIIEICEAAESGDDFAKELKRRMDSGEKTVHAAYCIHRIYEASKSGDSKGKFAAKLLPKIEKGQISENLAAVKMAEFKEKQNIEEESQDKTEYNINYALPSKGKYDVLLINPVEFHVYYKEYKLPCADNSIVFMLADNKNLSIAMKTMEYWGFKYQSMCVLTPRSTPYSDQWFKVIHNMLLIGIRGKSVIPVKTDYSSITNLESSENKTNAIYEMIEAMYPSGKYAHIGVKTDAFKRPGWNEYDNEPENTGDVLEDNTKPDDILEKPDLVNNTSYGLYDIDGLYEIDISSRVYQALKRNQHVIEEILTLNKYDKDYEMTSDKCTVTNQKTSIKGDQLNQLNIIAREHDAKDINEVITRLLEGSRKTHPMEKMSKTKRCS